MNTKMPTDNIESLIEIEKLPKYVRPPKDITPKLCNNRLCYKKKVYENPTPTHYRRYSNKAFTSSELECTECQKC